MVRIITDPANREGLTGATVVDWLETLAIAPFLLAAVVGVVVLAALLRRREPHTQGVLAARDKNLV
jgi:hypothetical protein